MKDNYLSRYMPSLVSNGIALTNPVDTGITSDKFLGANLDAMSDTRVIGSNLNICLEYDKNNTVPYYFMKRNNKGVISLYMAVAMKQTTFNPSHTGLINVNVWAITNMSNVPYTQNVYGSNQPSQVNVFPNGNPFSLYKGLFETQVNGAVLNGNVTTELLPTKLLDFNTTPYINGKGDNLSGDASQGLYIQQQVIGMWKQINIACEMNKPEDERTGDIDEETVEVVWNKYQSMLKTLQKREILFDTSAMYVSNNGVRLINGTFLSKNITLPTLSGKQFIDKLGFNEVSNLPDNIVNLVVRKSEVVIDPDSAYQPGLYQLAGLSTERIIIDDPEIARVTPESYSGPAVIKNTVNEDVTIDIRINERAYGRDGKAIPKPARTFNDLPKHTDILVVGTLLFVPNTSGHGVRAQVKVEEFKRLTSTNSVPALPNTDYQPEVADWDDEENVESVQQTVTKTEVGVQQVDDDSLND